MEPDYNLIQKARFRATGANIHHVNNKILAYTMCCEVIETRPDIMPSFTKAFKDLCDIAYPISDILGVKSYAKAMLHHV